MLGLYPLGPDTGSELCVHSSCGFLDILVAFSSFLKAMPAPISGLASPSHTILLCLSSWSSAEVNLQTFIYDALPRYLPSADAGSHHRPSNWVLAHGRKLKSSRAVIAQGGMGAGSNDMVTQFASPASTLSWIIPSQAFIAFRTTS